MARFQEHFPQFWPSKPTFDGGDDQRASGAYRAGFDLAAIGKAVGDNTRMVHVQRSCGYAWRPSISVDEIGRLATWLKAEHPGVVLFVDNCYGEF